MDVFWAVLRGILFFAGVSSTSTGSESGGGIYWVAVIGYIIGPFIYLFACVSSADIERDKSKIPLVRVG